MTTRPSSIQVTAFVMHLLTWVCCWCAAIVVTPSIRNALQDHDVELATAGKLVIRLSDWQANYFVVLTLLLILLALADFLVFRALAQRKWYCLIWLVVATIPPVLFAILFSIGLLLPYFLHAN